MSASRNIEARGRPNVKDSLLAAGNKMPSMKRKKKAHFGPPYLGTKSEVILKSGISFKHTHAHTNKDQHSWLGHTYRRSVHSQC